ncbi:MAG TPA: hypothetical protein PL137_11420, partial [Nocardioides sp.]|nr:hypothetical protein [Nocardioides sp.]
MQPDLDLTSLVRAAVAHHLFGGSQRLRSVELLDGRERAGLGHDPIQTPAIDSRWWPEPVMHKGF